MSQAAEVLISVRDLDKVYRVGGETVHALQGINLDIYRREYLSIMGPSGSGKSTLFNMLGALDNPTRGEVRVGEVSVPALGSRERAYFRCRHIGYVFQSYNLVPFLSALDNAALPLIFIGKEQDEAEERAADVLRYVGLGDRLRHVPGELSGGQQQRVAIARALVNHPSILLADEPTANLDFKTGLHIIETFKKLTQDYGVTVVAATHDHRMLATSDRIVWIEGGRLAKIQEVSQMRIQVGGIRTRS